MSQLIAPSAVRAGVRQTVRSGPVDSNGFAAFGGATGSAVVTAAGTLNLCAAYGNEDYCGTVLNPSWSGLSANGTMYLYAEISAAGAVTLGSTTLAPIYQHGGTYSIANGQHTFNVSEMTMKVGNGASAAKVARVFVGEVTVAAGVVSAIVWYALNGIYDSGLFAVALSSTYSKNHNIGSQLINLDVRFADDAAGTNERDMAGFMHYGAYVGSWHSGLSSRNACTVLTGSSNVAWSAVTMGAQITSGFYRFLVRRAF